jgi:hypothetical protein
MTVYYNILNILGDHAKKSKCNYYFGRFIRTRTSRWFRMSESIKTYLVDVFAINPSRIVLKVNLNQIFHQNNQVEHLN